MEELIFQELMTEDFLKYLHQLFEAGMKLNFFSGILLGLAISLLLFIIYQFVDFYIFSKQARKELKNKEKEV